LGWKLAQKGKKVILVDADPQCNLTGMMLQFRGIDEIESFYNTKNNHDIFSEVKGFLLGSASAPEQIKATKTGKENLALVVGNIDLGRAEPQIQLGLKTWTGIPRLAPFPGFYPKMIRELANSSEADYVLIDTAPSVSALNQCLLMGSDYFIIPTSPDYYSTQAIQSMARFIPDWASDTEVFRDGNADESMGKYTFPQNPPQFMGYIVQNYRINRGQPTSAFNSWIRKIASVVNETFVPIMQEKNMCVKRDDFLLGKFSDFNTLIAKSQEHAKPVFDLSEEEIGQAGVVLENAINSRNTFDEAFNGLAEKVIQISDSR
jgi:cellulose biosynthesis protein BcsQ